MYMGLASLTEDPVERFKFVIASMVGTFYWTNNFKKPVWIHLFYYYFFKVESYFGGNFRSKI